MEKEENEIELRVEGDDLLKEIAQAVTGFSSLPDEDNDRHRLEVLTDNQKENKDELINKAIHLIKTIGEAYLNDNDSGIMSDIIEKISTQDLSDPDTFEVISQITESIQENVNFIFDNSLPMQSFRNMSLNQQKSIGNDASMSSSSNIHQATKQSRSEKGSRPQDNFSDVDNSRNPFVPKLKSKPNAIVDLPPGGVKDLPLASSLSNSDRSGSHSYGYSNPYETEIRQARSGFPAPGTPHRPAGEWSGYFCAHR